MLHTEVRSPLARDVFSDINLKPSALLFQQKAFTNSLFMTLMTDLLTLRKIY